jgi:signal transduction histidine kinase
MVENKNSILLIDDGETNLANVSELLRKNGFNADIAENIDKGIKLFDEEDYDLVLVDLGIGGMNGIEVLKEIKKIDSESLVIIITGNDDIQPAIKALQNGASDYILKPCNKDEFVARISHCLEKKISKSQLQQNDEKLVEMNEKLKTEISLRNDSEKELKKNQEKLLKYVRELERSNQSLDEFAMIASHDLQEPLRKIIVFGDRLKNLIPELNDEATDSLERIFRAVHRMQELIRDLIQYSRINFSEKGAVPVDLNELVDEVVADLDLQISRSNGNVSADFLPTIQADPVQARLLFQNLIGNALKFSREGVPLDLHISCSEKKHGFQEIIFKDNGIGFDQKFANRIFQPFERLNAKLSYEGSGMGLAICKKIIDCFGGKVSAFGRPGIGAEFFIGFPEQIIEEITF